MKQFVVVRGEPVAKQWEHWPAQIAKVLGTAKAPTGYKVKWLIQQKGV